MHIEPGLVADSKIWLSYVTAAGAGGYAGGFIEHYLLPVIYPAGLTADLQTWLGIGALALNVAVYALVWRRRRLG